MFIDHDEDWMDFHAVLTLSMFKLYGISEVDLITNDDHEKTVDYESCWSSELSCSERNKRFVPECEPCRHPEHQQSEGGKLEVQAEA